MLVLNKRQKFNLIKLIDVYYAEKIEYVSDADLINYIQCKEVYKNCKIFNTLFIELKSNEEDLFKSFNRRTRKDIEKASKFNGLNIVLEIKPNSQLVKIFIQFFNEFARKKGIKNCNIKFINNAIKEKCLAITYAKLNDKILCMHLYIYDLYRARAICFLLY